MMHASSNDPMNGSVCPRAAGCCLRRGRHRRSRQDDVPALVPLPLRHGGHGPCGALVPPDPVAGRGGLSRNGTPVTLPHAIGGHAGPDLRAAPPAWGCRSPFAAGADGDAGNASGPRRSRGRRRHPLPVRGLPAHEAGGHGADRSALAACGDVASRLRRRTGLHRAGAGGGRARKNPDRRRRRPRGGPECFPDRRTSDDQQLIVPPAH